MQHCEFSETQFSFCFTFEYIKQFLPFVPLPIFPNTVEEGRVGGGYDVQINGNIYFQFKIPVYYDLVSNFWRRDWDVFEHEYYKIKLETDEEQFKLLKDLQSPTSEVYYATPEFHTTSDIGNFYSTDSIVPHSALFPIDSFPAYRSGYHHLIYSPNHNWGRLFSEPIKIEKKKSINPFGLFPDGKSDLTIYEQARQIRNILRKGEYKIMDDHSLNDNKPDQFVKNIYTILLTKYNIHWYPVISRQQRLR
ncbi:MAG TPA: hypothetical protein VF411_15015 [Bacteroidia bacterium]